MYKNQSSIWEAVYIYIMTTEWNIYWICLWFMNLPTLIPSVEPHDVKSNIIVMNIDKGPGLNITDLQAFLVTKDAMLISHPYSACSCPLTYPAGFKTSLNIHLRLLVYSRKFWPLLPDALVSGSSLFSHISSSFLFSDVYSPSWTLSGLLFARSVIIDQRWEVIPCEACSVMQSGEWDQRWGRETDYTSRLGSGTSPTCRGWPPRRYHIIVYNAPSRPLLLGQFQMIIHKSNSWPKPCTYKPTLPLTPNT